MSDEQIEQMHVSDYKKLIKNRAHDAAFEELQSLKEGHSKVKDNMYTDFKHMQPYFFNKNISNRQISIMFSLRSMTLRSIKANFPKMYSSILCPLCEKCEDTQNHILLCKVLQDILPNISHIVYEHMRGSEEQQTEFLKLYERYIKICDELLDGSTIGTSLPGLYSGPELPQAAPTGLSAGSGATSTSGVNPV